MANFENNNNGFSFNGNGHNHNGDHNEEIPEENYVYEVDDDEEHEHEHEYNNIAQSHSVSAYEETVHQVISLEFHDRGLTLDFSADEAKELGRVLAEVVKYLESKTR